MICKLGFIVIYGLKTLQTALYLFFNNKHVLH